jgi:pantoate--beta-alanine ligase
MQTENTIAGLRRQLALWRKSGDKIAFVPTMGNLHAGHLALVEHARALADRVVVSIFVNPMQFGPNEDFDRYPRTLAEDKAKLENAATDLLFAPPAEEIYPAGHIAATKIEVPGLSEELCGASRPGHFAGVATVVAKLFNIVQPDIALFGEKDYQQLLVIRRMVSDLCFPMEIVGVTTVREADGLALSSRNGYLDQDERKVAPRLNQALRETAELLTQGRRDFAALEAQGMKRLNEAGFEPEYFTVREVKSLREAAPEDKEVVILAAARLGKTRLIDNIRQSLIK